MTLTNELKHILGQQPSKVAPLSGGCVGEVYRAYFTDAPSVVVKVEQDASTSPLEIEGRMLTYLTKHTTVPAPIVHHCTPTILIMSFLEGQSHFSTQAEENAAEMFATLHTITADAFGFDFDTVIGGIHQPNPWTSTWLDFFREHRLLHMGKRAYNNTLISLDFLTRLERFADHLDQWLFEPEQPALLHGDAWQGNILASPTVITGLLDPALYFGHPEIELAFTTLFNTFGDTFYRHYNSLHPIAPEFFDIRKDLYNLYPLLVHVNLFGGSYVRDVDTILKRIGY